MGKELIRLKRRKKIIAQMEDFLERGDRVFIIHYSCESFYEKESSSRITSIAVRNLESGQTYSFSIHQIAEERHINTECTRDYYDELEKVMLERFFCFVERNQNMSWVHWNMRDVNYGFAAIEHRYRVLGGRPICIDEQKKFDLSRALIDVYGVGYIGHPRLEMLMNRNKISKKDFLSGQEEAYTFEGKEYVKLHQSTLRKVDTLANIFERAVNKTLQVDSTWFEQNGYNKEVLVELICKHWVVSLIGLITTIGGFITFIYNMVKV